MEIGKILTEINLLTDKIINLTRGGLTTTKLKILCLVAEYKDATPSFLIKKTGINKPNMALACKELIQQGFLLFEKNPIDNRSIVYLITEKTTNILNEYYKRISEIFKDEDSSDSFENVLYLLNKKV